MLVGLGICRLTVEEDQEQVLAWELEAFPAEDEPVWEDPEDSDSGDDSWLAELPGEVLADYLAVIDASPVSVSGTVAPTSVDAARPAAPDTVPPRSIDAARPAAPGTVPPASIDDVAPTSDDVAPTHADGACAGLVGDSGPATTITDDCADAGTSGSSGFVHGGAADGMAPGPVLAALADRVWQEGLSGLGDDQLTGVLQAAHRLGAWSAALELSAASELAARRKAEGRTSGDWRAFEHAEDELAAALTLTRYGAGYLLALALGLDRLPLTRAALTAGQIDERKARVIADELAGLDDEHAAAVEAAIIPDAPGQTSTQLRAAARRAVIAADPAAAKRRKEQALKGSRVEAFTESSGTAALAGRDLPPAGVLAADKHLTALAQAMKNTGIPGTMDQLRARAYLHLLGGQPVSTLLTADNPGPSTWLPGSWLPGTGTAGNGSSGTGPRGTWPAGTGTAQDGAPGTGTRGIWTARDAAPGTGVPTMGTPWDGTAWDGALGNGGDRNGTGGPGAPDLGLPALRGTVNLTMPLATWLGWSDAPGHVPGFGPIDCDDSRTLATQLAATPVTRWCITLTDPAGHPVAHGCARAGPRPRPQADPRAGPGRPGWIRAVTITPLDTGTCAHRQEGSAYRPPQSLRHLIQIRQATCAFPGCRRPAVRCDLDHTIAYGKGGRTCWCNMAPLCRSHHAAKQAPNWTLAQDKPGIMTWTTPDGRSYTTQPTRYLG